MLKLLSPFLLLVFSALMVNGQTQAPPLRNDFIEDATIFYLTHVAYYQIDDEASLFKTEDRNSVIFKTMIKDVKEPYLEQYVSLYQTRLATGESIYHLNNSKHIKPNFGLNIRFKENSVPDFSAVVAAIMMANPL